MVFADYFKLKASFNSHFTSFISYLIAFIIATSLALYFSNSSTAIVAIYTGFFALVLIVNSLIYKHFTLLNKALTLSKDLFRSSAENDCLFSLILDDKNNIISYYQSEDLGLTPLPITNIDELGAALKKLNISFNDIEEIFKFIYLSNDIDLYFKKTLGPFPYNETSILISLSILKEHNNYKVIKVFNHNHTKQLEEVSSQLSIGYYELDKSGFITEINEYFASILGHDASEIITSHQQLSSLVEIENQSGNINAKNVASALKSDWQGLLTINNKKEKSYIAAEQQAIVDEDGECKKIIGYVLKLPDQSFIEKSKKSEKAWVDYSWRSFFEESPYPVTILDKHGKILKINTAFEEILPEKVGDKNLVEFFAYDDQEKIKKQIETIMSKETQPDPLHGLRLISNSRVVDIYIRKILNFSGEIFGFIATITDITQQNELKESFSHAQRMQTIGHLVGSVAHDFNNILTAITGFCDLLLMRHTVGDPSFSNIIQIKQSSDRASNLVKRLLAFSRKQTLQLQLVNLNDLFSDFNTLIQRLVGNDIVFNQQIEPTIWLVKIDIVQMEQVILNLAVNAHQAMSKGGKLLVKAYNVTLEEKDPYLNDFIAPAGEALPPSGDYVAIEVEDSGYGIPPKIIRQIFEPFFTTKLDKSGTGLGLSTVYGIIRQSEGYIYVKSNVGVGTTFLIYLKRHHYTREEVEEARSLKEQAASPEIKKDLSGKGVIALIEDEESIRLFAKSALTNKGYEVIEFASAKLALKNISPNLDRIDLIISDVMMPEVSGPAMAKEIRKIKPHIKIIFISGYGEEAFTQEYGDSRDFDFIPKPFTLKQLASKVKEVIERDK